MRNESGESGLRAQPLRAPCAEQLTRAHSTPSTGSWGKKAGHGGGSTRRIRPAFF